MKKRQAKKKKKQQEQQILKHQGYSRKQAKKLDKSKREKIVKEERRKEQKRQAQKRYNEKRKKIAKELGVSYSKFSLKELLKWKEERDKNSKEWDNFRKQQDKKRTKNKRKTGTEFQLPTYLYIGFYDKAGEIDILNYQYTFTNTLTPDIGRQLMESFLYYIDSGSSGRAGNIIIDTEVESPRWFMVTEGNRNEQKGYQTIMVDKFTVRGALILMCSLIENCREDAREFICKKLNYYFGKNKQLHNYIGEFVDWDILTGRKNGKANIRKSNVVNWKKKKEKKYRENYKKRHKKK